MGQPRYALHGQPVALPASGTPRGGVYSVPRPDGGYDYYQGPPGSQPPLNDDFPPPTVAHPNTIGVSALTLGRPLPPGSMRIGQGDTARGSITPMPGVRADGPLTSGLGSATGELGPLASFDLSNKNTQLAIAAVIAVGVATVVYRKRR